MKFTKEEKKTILIWFLLGLSTSTILRIIESLIDKL